MWQPSSEGSRGCPEEQDDVRPASEANQRNNAPSGECQHNPTPDLPGKQTMG